jgi:peptidoglycan/LPS O-acetylase OafA/YrhL
VHLLAAAGVGAGYVTNVLLANGSTVPAHYLWHLWSLAEEEQFYLLWPPILLLALRRRIPVHLLAGSLAVLVCAVGVERLALLASGVPDRRI